MLMVLVVGAGSAGRRHLRNLRRIEPGAVVTAWRHSRDEGNPKGELVDRVVHTREAAMNSKPDLALITCPANLHVERALPLAEAGVHLLVEKPLSCDTRGVDELIECCRGRVALMVGYNLRFSPALRALRAARHEGRIGRLLSVHAEVGQFLPDWRPDIDYRRSVSARRELGGGALLELSHEIDYVRWLVGEVAEVSARIDRVSDLEIDVEDVADLIVRFENGVAGSIHLDMVQRTPTRTCRLVGTEGTLVWDALAGRVLCSGPGSDWKTLFEEATPDRNDTYLAELRHFLDCTRGIASPEVTGEDGRRVLEIALAARRSSEEGRVVKV